MKLEDLFEKQQWVKDVKTKKHPPEDLFAKGTAGQLLAWLKKEHSDLKGAMSALNFYINRAGKKLDSDRRATLDHVKKMLHAEVEAAAEKKED